MGYLPQTKFGSCTQCPATNVNCVKVGKSLVCIPCHRGNKNTVQIQKANARDRERAEAVKGLAPKKKRELKGRIKNDVRNLGGSEMNLQAPVKERAELERWFFDRRGEMTGRCANCGDKSCKSDNKYFKFSIAHLLPKKIFKSVATHPDNWIELCFFGKSCHTNFDNHMIDLIDLNCFDLVIQKFVKILPHIAKEELRHIPKILLEYADTEK